MPQGLLPFKLEEEGGTTRFTGLTGLFTYLELARCLGLLDAVTKHVEVRKDGQGWTDRQMVTALVMLNLAGGDCVDDLRRLEEDEGFGEVLKQVEVHDMRRADRRRLLKRWRKERTRTVPSPSAVFRYLEKFVPDESGRETGKAWIPEATKPLQGLRLANRDLIAGIDARNPQAEATLDSDATLVATTKKGALYCYKGFKSYQPLNVYWAEHEVVLHSEFREGNVPAGYQQLRVLQEALTYLPEGVKRVRFRADSAAFQYDLLFHMARGDDERFGVIDFAVSADVNPEFRAAVALVPGTEWKAMNRAEPQKDGTIRQVPTGQEYAEVCYVTKRQAQRADNPPLRFVATRELLNEADQLRFPGIEADQLELPFPVIEFTGKRYKLHSVVTNRHDMPAQDLILWHRERCGKSEEVHAIMKEDLAGGTMPCGDFGSNAAWWAIMILALNLNSAMKRLVLKEGWVNRRLKALRFHLICLPGRIIMHARQLILRVAGRSSYDLLDTIRRRILCLTEVT